MKFNLWLLCSAVVVYQAYAADDVYLEGISSVGERRVAYVLVNKAKFSLKEGEQLTRWTVTKIGQRSIVLADAKGSETELVLHNRVPTEPESPPVAENSPSTSTPTEHKADTAADIPATEDVPKGYRKVKTPFGEVVIQEEAAKPPPEAESVAPASPPPQDAAKPPPAPEKEPVKEEEVRPGYHKVRTPFGDIWLEDKKQSPSANKDAKDAGSAMK